jgi:hypothetical protein
MSGGRGGIIRRLSQEWIVGVHPVGGLRQHCMSVAPPYQEGRGARWLSCLVSAAMPLRGRTGSTYTFRANPLFAGLHGRGMIYASDSNETTSVVAPSGLQFIISISSCAVEISPSMVLTQMTSARLWSASVSAET